MIVEKDLEGILNTEELKITPEAEQYRYMKMLGEFYAKLVSCEPQYMYDQITEYHMDYIQDLLYIEKALEAEEYKNVIALLQQNILNKKGYILQGRIYHNLQEIFEAHIYETIIEHVNPVTIKMKKMTQSSVFDYRLGSLDKKKIKKEFLDKLEMFNFDSTNAQNELNKFVRNIQECFQKKDIDKAEKIKRFNLIFKYILNDIKTDSLTLFIYYNEERRQYHIFRYIKSKNTTFYDNCFLLNTDGIRYYYPDQKETTFASVKDFRVACAIKMYNLI